jgi:hypothetical protein
VGRLVIVAVLSVGGLALGGRTSQGVMDALIRSFTLLDREGVLILGSLGAIKAGVALLLVCVGVDLGTRLGLSRGALASHLFLGGKGRGSGVSAIVAQQRMRHTGRGQGGAVGMAHGSGGVRRRWLPVDAARNGGGARWEGERCRGRTRLMQRGGR